MKSELISQCHTARKRQLELEPGMTLHTSKEKLAWRNRDEDEKMDFVKQSPQQGNSRPGHLVTVPNS